MRILSFLLSILAQCTITTCTKMASMSLRNGHQMGMNKLIVQDTNSTADSLQLDNGWYRFFFGGPLQRTAYNFSFNYPDYLQISITDAYCSGDSFDLLRNDSYLITTPRVISDKCEIWTDDPDVAFVNPLFSSTKFMLPPNFNFSISTLDSPYGGGAAYIKIDTRLGACPIRSHNITLVTAPVVGHRGMTRVCERIGGVPLDITFDNSMHAASILSQCGHQSAWINKVRLATPGLKRMASEELGCLSFSATDPNDPTVEILPCDSAIPVLCQLS